MHLRFLIHSRLASTTSSSNPFPYPTHRHPKPHEIFHLPRSATQAEIKSRYIDLVRAHHPDSALCSHLSPSERHTRFQAISLAYNELRRKPAVYEFHSSYNDRFNQELEIRARRKKAQDSEFGGTRTHNNPCSRGADSATEKPSVVPILFGGLLIFLGIIPGMTSQREEGHQSASFHLAEARKEAQLFGQERRRAIRKQARKYELARLEEEQYRNHSCLSGGRSRDDKPGD